MTDFVQDEYANETPVVTITVDTYMELLADSFKLRKLEAAGVDNWEGYSEAMEDTSTR